MAVRAAPTSRPWPAGGIASVRAAAAPNRQALCQTRSVRLADGALNRAVARIAEAAEQDGERRGEGEAGHRGSSSSARAFHSVQTQAIAVTAPNRVAGTSSRPGNAEPRSSQVMISRAAPAPTAP